MDLTGLSVHSPSEGPESCSKGQGVEETRIMFKRSVKIGGHHMHTAGEEITSLDT
jgi:hypothetical protein